MKVVANPVLRSCPWSTSRLFAKLNVVNRVQVAIVVHDADQS